MNQALVMCSKWGRHLAHSYVQINVGQITSRKQRAITVPSVAMQLSDGSKMCGVSQHKLFNFREL